MKIEKGVPLPPRLSERVEVGPLPLREMKVGDSILVPAATQRELERKLVSCRIRLARFSRKHRHYKFRLAKESERGLRIWRVSRASG